MPEPTDVIITEAPAPEAAAPKPTAADVVKDGWTPAEIKSAKAKGLLADEKPPETPPVPPAGAPKTPPEAEKPPLAAPKPPERKAGIPGVDDVTLTPDEEAVLLRTFGPGHPVRGLYFRQKNERQARQRVERDSQNEISELKARLAALENPRTPPNPEDEDKPLTEKRLREIREQDAAAALREQDALNERGASLRTAQKSQEEYMRGQHEDFDSSVELALDLIQNADTLLPNKAQRTKAANLYRMLKQAATSADRFDVEEYNAAHIAYELGQMHPKYGQSADNPGTLQDDPMPGSDTGKLTPEQMKRVAKNNQPRVPSAAVGGGSRKVAVSEVTAEMLLAMDFKNRDTFKKNHPARYAEILGL